MNSNQQSGKGKFRSSLKQILQAAAVAVIVAVVGFLLPKIWTYIENVLINIEPKAIIDTPQLSGEAPCTVWLYASKSHDPDGKIADLRFVWILEKMEEGAKKDTISRKQNDYYKISKSGSYRVELIVIDKKGAEGHDNKFFEVQPSDDTLSLNAPPVAVINIDPTAGMAPFEVSFDTEGSSDPEGDSLIFNWILDTNLISSNSSVKYTFDKPGSYRVELAVIDKKGQIGRATKFITVFEDTVGKIPTDNHLYSIAINTPYRNDTIHNIETKLHEIGFNIEEAALIDVQENEIIYYSNRNIVEAKVKFIISFFKRKFDIQLQKQSFNHPTQDTLFTITLK